MQRKAVVGGMVSLLSVLASAVFVWIGVSMILPTGTPFTVRAFGSIAIAYGLASGFLLALIANSLDGDKISTVEWAGVALAGILVFSNWLAVKRVVGLRRI